VEKKKKYHFLSIKRFLNMIRLAQVLLAVVGCAMAAPDKRPSYSAPAPPQYQAPKPAYRPAPQAPRYQAAPQETQYNYAPAPAAYNQPRKVIAILSQDFKMDDYGYTYK
jgi:hypothetical protein